MIIRFKEISSSYFANILQLSSSIILMPIILLKLNVNEIGVWYLFLSIYQLLSLLDFGITPSIQRFVAYLKAGANKLIKEGIPLSSNFVNKSYYSTFLIVVAKLYRFLSIIFILLGSTLGVLYLSKNIGIRSINNGIISWFIFLVAICINFNLSYFNPVLIGRGEIVKANFSIIVSRILYLVTSIVLLKLNFGLLSLAIGQFVGVFVGRIIAWINYKSDEDILFLKYNKEKSKEIKSVLLISSGRLGLSSLGFFLVSKSTMLFLATRSDNITIASFGITNQLYTVLYSFSAVLLNSFLPKIQSQLQKKMKRHAMNLFTTLNIISLSLFILGSFFICNFAPYILRIFNSNVVLLDFKYQIIIILALLLELNQAQMATFISCSNSIPYAKSAIISGMIILICNLLYIVFPIKTDYLLGLLLIRFIVQLSYNNWKWPFEVIYKDFNMNILEFYSNGIIQILKRRKYE